MKPRTAARRTAATMLSAVLLTTLVACGSETAPPTAPTASDTLTGTVGSGDPIVIGTVATDLDAPWGIAFLPDRSALVTERNTGRILQVTGDGIPVREVGRVDETVAQGESGLLGIAVSPAFDSDRSVFLYVTTTSDNRVLRTTFDGTTLSPPEVILDGIPAGRIHDGGRMIFGPDGLLYVATGEAGRRELAQDPDSLGGKILRITTEGAPAPGNPDPDSPVYSSGHRNVQGLAFDDRGRLWASEFGQNDVDELNEIVAGGNYGWPAVEGIGGEGEFIDPVLTWPVASASPSGLAFADGYLWMAGLRGERLWRIDPEDPTHADDYLAEEHGRLRSVVAAPDGALWLSTSNRDGRGEPAADDDRILLVEIS